MRRSNADMLHFQLLAFVIQIDFAAISEPPYRLNSAVAMLTQQIR